MLVVFWYQLAWVVLAEGPLSGLLLPYISGVTPVSVEFIKGPECVAESDGWRIFTCAQKLANSHLNLPHGTKQKRLMKKLKIKTEMLRRNGPVIKPWSQS